MPRRREVRRLRPLRGGRITHWFHEDDVCWIAECEICDTPMVVWRWHGIDPSPEALAHMHGELARVSADGVRRPLRRRQHAQHPRPLPRPRPAPGRLLRSRSAQGQGPVASSVWVISRACTTPSAARRSSSSWWTASTDGWRRTCLLRPLYPDDLSGPRRHLALFLQQYWGGPGTYSEERGHPRLRQRHVPFVISEAERDAWFTHMAAALDEVVVAHGDRSRRSRRRCSTTSPSPPTSW